MGAAGLRHDAQVSRRVRRWLEQMAEVEQRGPGPDGWGPSVERLAAGQTAFAGRVTAGEWVGHDVLINAYLRTPSIRERLRNRVVRQDPGARRAEALGFDAVMWQVDPAAPGGKDPDPWIGSLENVLEYVAPMSVEWLPSVAAAKASLRQRD